MSNNTRLYDDNKNKTIIGFQHDINCTVVAHKSGYDLIRLYYWKKMLKNATELSDIDRFIHLSFTANYLLWNVWISPTDKRE